MVSDGPEADGTGARRGATRVRQRRAGKPPYAHLEAELAAARKRIVGLEQQAEERERRLAEGLEQQTATAEVLAAISRAPTDLQRVLDAIADTAARLCGAVDTAIYRLDGETLTPVTGIAHSQEARDQARRLSPRPMPLARQSVVGRAALERWTIHLADVLAEPDAEYRLAKERARLRGNRTLLATPLLRDGAAVGAIMVRRAEVRPFTPQQIRLLETFADQAVIALENARLFTELQESNRTLTEALEQQTATAEVLRIIASSPTDLQAVLDTIAERAARLSGAQDATIDQVIGAELVKVANFGTLPGSPVGFGRPVATELTELTMPADQAVFLEQTVHIPDVAAYTGAKDWRRRNLNGGVGAALATPLLRDGNALGAILIRRRSAGPFSDQQIAVLESFANQAVIAIENARLFSELRERLEQQTATAEILRAISQSPTDLQTVLDIILESAARLCDASDGVIFRVDPAERDVVYSAARFGPHQTRQGQVRARLSDPRPTPSWVPGHAILEQRTVHAPDTLALPQDTGTFVATTGIRSRLAAPLLREGTAIGSLTVDRVEPRPFTAQQIALLETFADQAVIAIENARLFAELQESNRDLTESAGAADGTAEVLAAISQRAHRPAAGAGHDRRERGAAVRHRPARMIFRVEGETYRSVARRWQRRSPAHAGERGGQSGLSGGPWR